MEHNVATAQGARIKMKISILYSGGLDSFLLYRYAKKNYPNAEISTVYFKHGSISEQKEIESLPSFVKIREVKLLDEDHYLLSKNKKVNKGSIYISGRNLVFTVLLGSLDLPDEIWLGSTWEDDYPNSTDKNEHFRQATSDLLSYVLSPFTKNSIKVRFPIVELNLSKRNLVKYALTNKLATKNEILKTVSCYNFTQQLPCGECWQCFSRALIFKLENIESEKCMKDPFTSTNYIEKHKHIFSGNVKEIEFSKNIEELKNGRI